MCVRTWLSRRAHPGAPRNATVFLYLFFFQWCHVPHNRLPSFSTHCGPPIIKKLPSLQHRFSIISYFSLSMCLCSRVEAFGTHAMIEKFLCVNNLFVCADVPGHGLETVVECHLFIHFLVNPVTFEPSFGISFYL